MECKEIEKKLAEIAIKQTNIELKLLALQEIMSVHILEEPDNA